LTSSVAVLSTAELIPADAVEEMLLINASVYRSPQAYLPSVAIRRRDK